MRLLSSSGFGWPVGVVVASILLSGGVLGCRTHSFDTEPLGQIPDVSTSAEPLWIPYRVMAGQAYAADPREGRLADLRRITFDGKSSSPRWHPDGRRLLFERGTPGCADVVEMDLATGETARLSPRGGGASVGGYVDDPSGLVFLKTESPSPPCRPAFADGPPRWSPSSSDVWLKGPHAEPARPLLPSPEAEMELTVSRDKIVFTSIRDGDPELYLARTDGTEMRRITHAPGYDGGAALSPDATRLAWHAERAAVAPPDAPAKPPPAAKTPRTKEAEKTEAPAAPAATAALAPETLQLFVAGAEGQHARALGAFGRFDVEPSFLPDSRHLLFGSDYDAEPDGPPTFEIYLADVDAGPRVGGGLAAERVTYHPAYDGQATISPDGRWIAFVSTRAAVDEGPGPAGELDIYVARWQAVD